MADHKRRRLPRLKLPRMEVKGRFTLFPPQIPKLVIRWYKEVAPLEPLPQITKEEAERIAKELCGSLVIPRAYLEEAMKEIIQTQKENRKNE